MSAPMSPRRGARVIDAALALLERERALLLEGRFAEMERAATERGAQVEQLGALDATAAAALRPALETLRAAAGRNGALLKAAIEGAAAARRRLASLRDAQTRLPSYNAAGAPVDHVAPVTAQGRRA